MQQEGIDWYAISKVNPHTLDLTAFSRAISSGQGVDHGLERVSLQYRKKLLILFQMAVMKIKAEKEEIESGMGDLLLKRDRVALQMGRREEQAEKSFKQISEMRLILQQKKRMLAKFKQKAKKQPQKQGVRIYVCPQCQKEQFVTIQALKVHMEGHHARTSLSDRGEGVNQIKELLMTMKDKQMEMMSMFLRASRQSQTEQLQRAYQRDYQKAMQVSGKTQLSKDEEEGQELHGESKFLFFQKSEGVRRQMERDQEFRAKFQQKKIADQEELNKEFYQNSRNYYQVFGSVQENESQEELDRRKSPVKKEQSHEAYYDPNQVVAKFIRNYGQRRDQAQPAKDSRVKLMEHTPKPYLQFKQTQLVEQSSVKENHRENNSIFSTKRKFQSSDRGYVFNCGPLEKDPGGDSDYEDYFGVNANGHSRIEDQEIKMSFVGQSKPKHQNINKNQSFNLSKLLSPKEQSSASVLDKERSSINLEFSDSFTRKDFELSKDETVNLSDLRLSKLQKKREEEKKAAQMLTPPHNASYTTQNQEEQRKLTSSNPKQELKQVEYNALKSFEKEVAPLRPQNYKFQEYSSPVNPFLKSQKERVSMVASYQAHSPRDSNIGVLSQFLRQGVDPAPIAPSKAQLQDYMRKR